MASIVWIARIPTSRSSPSKQEQSDRTRKHGLEFWKSLAVQAALCTVGGGAYLGGMLAVLHVTNGEVVVRDMSCFKSRIRTSQKCLKSQHSYTCSFRCVLCELWECSQVLFHKSTCISAETIKVTALIESPAADIHVR